MGTGRAFLRWLGTLVDVSALAAVPDNGILAFEHLACLKVVDKVPVLFGMLFLGGGNGPENTGDLGKALFLGNLGEFRIHLLELVLLTGRRGFQVFQGGADDSGGKGRGYFHFAAFEHLEKGLGVGPLLFGGAIKDGGNLLVTFLLACLA